MGVFDAKDMTVRTGILEETGHGQILEIEFNGIHTHHWPEGGSPGSFIDGEVNNSKPAAILFNFAKYHYEWGDEIGGLILSACIATRPDPVKHMAIIATGVTARSLRSLLSGMNLERVFKLGLFEDIESGRSFLRRALEDTANTPEG